MTVVELIYLVAALLWIVVVATALGVAGHYLLKIRARRRRINGLIEGARMSVEHALAPYRAVAVVSVTLLHKLVGAAVADAPGRTRR